MVNTKHEIKECYYVWWLNLIERDMEETIIKQVLLELDNKFPKQDIDIVLSIIDIFVSFGIAETDVIMAKRIVFDKLTNTKMRLSDLTDYDKSVFMGILVDYALGKGVIDKIINTITLYEKLRVIRNEDKM